MEDHDYHAHDDEESKKLWDYLSAGRRKLVSDRMISLSTPTAPNSWVRRSFMRASSEVRTKEENHD